MISSSLYHHLIILFLLLLTNQLAAQTYRNISIGTTLTPLAQPTSWLSPSGDFAFGFRPLETDSTLFLLAVWYNKIAGKTVVWTANGDNPVGSGSKVELTSDGQLSLKNQTGQEIWNPDASNISYGAVLDTGNFVLVATDSTIKWQSFDNPTDTILPSQVLKSGNGLYARLMDSDYSRGRFAILMEDNGNLVAYPVAYQSTFLYTSYWDSGTSGSGVRLVYEQSGSIYLALANGSELYTVSFVKIAGDSYQRATFDPDGVFRQYSLSKNEAKTGSWVLTASVATHVCDLITTTGSGACGFNSYCTLGSDGRANCQCPPHYSFLDPDRKYRGCKPDFAPQSCEPGGESLFDFVEMGNMDWAESDSDQLSPINDDQCKDKCLKDCFCLGAVYKNGTCWKKKFPLSNGHMGSAIDRTVFLKFSNYNNTNPFAPKSHNGRRHWETWVIPGSLSFSSSVILNLFLVVAFVCKRRRRFPRRVPSGPGPALCSFTYKELEHATKGFSEELGRGAFGTVYKGVVAYSESHTLIAVKKLESLLEEAEKDFANEVNTIGQTHHKNLVRLLGFCKEGSHRLLVYEFMCNGSLNRWIFGENLPTWTQRVQIATGIAEGLAYLHEECRMPIIHCDIKPQNILLDDNYVARISDFGLAKLLRLDQTRTKTIIRGTIGYFAPEWFKHVAITAKVDAYSFGVMLLEIICCRRNLELGTESAVMLNVIDRAKECCATGRLDLLVEDDNEAKNDGARLERFVMVGISCIQDEPCLRPSMRKVVQMLEGSIAVSIPPNMFSVRLQNESEE